MRDLLHFLTGEPSGVVLIGTEINYEFTGVSKTVAQMAGVRKVGHPMSQLKVFS